MVYWIKKSARILSIITFFVVFFIGLDPAHPFDPQIAAVALLKGFCGAVLFWFAGFILGDIVFKSIVTGVETTQTDEIEGGLLQRIHDEKKKTHPDTAAGTPAPHGGTPKSASKKKGT
jgi:hypothetical protein